MGVASAEEPLNRIVEHDRPGRQFLAVEGSRWGELILPAPDEAGRRPPEGLRVLAVTCFNFSLDLLGALSGFESARPGRLRLQAVATDDPVNAEAKIGLKKRFWRVYAAEEQFRMEVATVEAALAAGLPVYTGELKIDAFRRLLADWAPDAVIVMGCGQVFDDGLLTMPRCGVYNFHPSDLARGHGAGPQPYEDLVARGDVWTCWTVHRMSADVDSGPVVGQSPPIFAGDAAGQVTLDERAFLERLRLAVPTMTTALAEALVAADGPVGNLDFAPHFPPALCTALRQPI